MDFFLLKSDEQYYLLTDSKEKTDSSFEYWRNHYRKEIDPYDECVEDQYLLKEICIKNGVKCIPKINEKVHLTKEDFVEFWVKNI